MNEQSSVQQPTGGIPIAQLISDSERLNQWLYQLIRPAIKGKVLEVGSGGGNLSSLFVQHGFALHISDPDKFICKFLKKRFGGEKAIKGIHQLDISTLAFETTYMGLIERFDTIISVDQHFNEPIRLSNAKRLLRHRGRLIVLLPAHIALYEESELGFGCWRRSNRQDIRVRMGKDFEVLHTQFFAVSTISRSVETVDRESSCEVDQESQYHQYVPVFRMIEGTVVNQVGLYVFAVARKISV